MSTGASQIDVEVVREAAEILGLGGGGAEILWVREEQPNNTSSGAFTAGSYVTRVLNTVKLNQISGASLAANQITLPDGTYNIMGRAPAFRTNRTKAKLRNVSDASDEIIGESNIIDAVGNGGGNSSVIGQFEVSSGPKIFELQHRAQTTGGLGTETNFGDIEVYAEVWLEKVA